MNASSAPAESVARPQNRAIGVRDLAAFVHRRGDIHYRYEKATLAEEGIARQKEWQKSRGDGYRREFFVSGQRHGIEVSGRVDGWDAAQGVVEEIKTTRVNARSLHEHLGHLNLAQLRLYAGMLALAGETPKLLRLVYLHPDEPGEFAVEEPADAAALMAFVDRTCGAYAEWLSEVAQRVARRDASLRSLGFPYGGFRAHQHGLARRIYRAWRDEDHLLVDAPTGSGKTMAAAFPGFKAMGEGEVDRLLVLTSRTTGQGAFEQTFGDLVDAGADIFAVTVTAKARICFNPELPCDPELCEFARGHFDRMPAARNDLLARGVADRAAVEEVAREHRVCPFELSVDAAAWSDAIMGDCNYVFDPVVRLARLKTPTFPRAAVLVDEAHRLGERVRDMLGATLSREVVRKALRECSGSGLGTSASNGDRAYRALAPGLRSVDRALASLARTVFGPARERRAGEREIEAPAALLRAIERLLRDGVHGAELPRRGAAQDAWFDLSRLHMGATRAAESGEDRGATEFAWVVRWQRRNLTVELVCAAPGTHIRTRLGEFQGSVRMSGSFRPAATYQVVQGFGEDASAAEVPGRADGLGLYVVADVSTYYRDRVRTLPVLANLVRDVAQAHPGGYLVALPSFDYAEQTHAAFVACLHRVDGEGLASRCQQRAMDLDERAAFIHWMGADEGAGGDRTRIGFVVMGGLFAESVDYPPDALDGVIVVGPGLPPKSLRRDLVARAAAAQGLDGHAVGYRQEAMTRVVQAAGRVVRGPEDRGIVLLVDPRFTQPAFTAFFPSHWHPTHIRAHTAAAHARAFWASGALARASRLHRAAGCAGPEENIASRRAIPRAPASSEAMCFARDAPRGA